MQRGRDRLTEGFTVVPCTNMVTVVSAAQAALVSGRLWSAGYLLANTQRGGAKQKNRNNMIQSGIL